MGGDDMGTSQMMLGQQMGQGPAGPPGMQQPGAGPGMGGMPGGGGGGDQDSSQNTMTPQDQLSKFVETL